jgi:hypothetical protein
MKIKNYMEFIVESSGYKFGCVMLKVPFTNWIDITNRIEPEDVYDGDDDKHGLEDDPHLTLLYGLEPEVSECEIKSIMNSFGKPLDIEIDGIDIFENENFDVVKFNIRKSSDLQSIHDKLSQLPNQDSYPDYKPHITISYVNKGSGKKYLDPNFKLSIKGLSEICYSMPSGKKVYFNI